MPLDERTVQTARARTIVQALAQQVIDLMDDEAVTERVQSDLAEVEGVLTPAPSSLPTREQIAEAMWARDIPSPFSDADVEEQEQYLGMADAVLALLPTLVAPSAEQIAAVISDALVYDTTTDSDVIDADLAANRVHALLSQLTEPTVQVPEVDTAALRRIEAQVHGSSARTRESVQRIIAAGDTPPNGVPALVVHADRAALGLRDAADEIDRLRALIQNGADR